MLNFDIANLRLYFLKDFDEDSLGCISGYRTDSCFSNCFCREETVCNGSNSLCLTLPGKVVISLRESIAKLVADCCVEEICQARIEFECSLYRLVGSLVGNPVSYTNLY